MLDLHLSLMIVVLVIFFILLVQLNNRLYQPLLRFMDRRRDTIARDLKEASALGSDTDVLLNEAKAKVEEAKSKAAKLRQEATEESKSKNLAALEAKQEELAKEYEEFLVKLEEEKEVLKSSILSQLPLIKESLKAKFSQI